MYIALLAYIVFDPVSRTLVLVLLFFGFAVTTAVTDTFPVGLIKYSIYLSIYEANVLLLQF